MLRLRFDPPDAHAALVEHETVARLVSGDALDVAMFGTSLLGAVIGEARAAGATRVELEVEGAGDVHRSMAAAHGLELVREIHRLARDLPVGEPWALDVRPFRVGEDEEAWLEVNNRAFSWHPDQGGWTIDDIRAREAEDWFDPEGFLLHERDGRLAGFCWTKVHADERPPLGEIFAIAVDPDFHGQGLGRPLVLAGLDHLAQARRLRDGILYVEASNAPALRLYESLGFTVATTNRWWRRDLVS